MEKNQKRMICDTVVIKNTRWVCKLTLNTDNYKIIVIEEKIINSYFYEVVLIRTSITCLVEGVEVERVYLQQIIYPIFGLMHF